MDIKILHAKFLECESLSIDTRKIHENSFFVAIKGENFDANTFAQEALNKGARYVIIDNEQYYINEKTIVVDDSLETLQKLAHYHRIYLKLPIIALTGSNGKTTTKELIHAILSKKFKTKATVGNLNNHIGVPLTLLSFTNDTEIGIVEMGANHQKEIELLCNIAEPNFGYITNFGKAHLEGFGGVEGVIKGKSEMYTYLHNFRGKVFVNLDDTLQSSKTITLERITFSQKSKNASVFIDSVEANPLVTIGYNNLEIKSNLIGLYNANNVIAAITMGIYFTITNKDIKEAIESFFPENNRSQLITKNSNEIILDAYNANPSSMKVALENFIQLDKSNKVIILGDMFELGEESNLEHQEIINQLKSTQNIDTYFIGNDFYNNKIEKDRFQFYKSFDDFSNNLNFNEFQNKSILIKGSRGMALERILQFLP